MKRLFATGATAAVVVGTGFASAPAANAATAERVRCVNTVTKMTILNVVLPTTALRPGTYTAGRITCTVTATDATPTGTKTVHVVCTNTVTHQTIVDVVVRAARLQPGNYRLGPVACTVTAA